MQIRKAERKKSKLRLGLSGPSGSGKTWSALEIATGMGGRIGMIDTEAGRGELYGDDFDYDIIRLDAPFSPDRYIEAIKKFEKDNYDILLIDSLSHAWIGEGGVLSIVNNAGNNSFTQGWKVGTPKQNALIDAIITSKLHIMVTLRTKTDWVIETNDKGKAQPRKVGLAPVQREGLEYEFTVFMDLNQDHIAHFSKDNTKMFDQQYIKPTKEMGKQLIEWLNYGKTIEEPERSEVDETARIDLIDTIKNSNSITELKENFIKASRQLRGDDDGLDKLIKEKDKRRSELEVINTKTGEVTPNNVERNIGLEIR